MKSHFHLNTPNFKERLKLQLFSIWDQYKYSVVSVHLPLLFVSTSLVKMSPLWWAGSKKRPKLCPRIYWMTPNIEEAGKGKKPQSNLVFFVVLACKVGEVVYCYIYMATILDIGFRESDLLQKGDSHCRRIWML